MKRELFIRTTFHRPRLLNATFFDLLYALSSYPRLLLEVLIRKNFGERYFTFTSCIHVLIGLVAFPILWSKVSDLYHSFLNPHGFFFKASDNIIANYWTWYLFTLLFFISAIRRKKETYRKPTEFDFDKFSRSMGQINSHFYNINLPFIKTNPWVIEILYEPVFFLIIGIGLNFLEQPVGTLLIISSILYSISYLLAYNKSAMKILDGIDEMHGNKLKRETYSSNPDNDGSGKFKMHKPDPRKKNSDDSHKNSADDELTFVA